MIPAIYPTRVPALVTGTGNTTLGTIRALGRKGIPAFVGHASAGYEAASRWYQPVPGGWSADSLVDNLRRCSLKHAVLMPTSDTAALAAATLPPDLKARFPSSSADGDLTRWLIDKDHLARLLVTHDVPHPRTWSLTHPDDIRNLDDATLKHSFLKPRDSIRFTARFNKKSIRPRGREALLATHADLVLQGFEMVLQEFIPGPPTNCYLIDGHVDRNGAVSGVFARQRVRQYPLDFGNSSALQSIPLGNVSAAWDILSKFLKDIGYRGIFNAEFKQHPDDGGFRLLEVNPRAWWYVEFAARCGVDTVTMAYEDALGLSVSGGEGYDVGRRVIYPYFDLAACRAMRRTGDISLTEIVRWWSGAEQMIYAADDPRPFVVATRDLISGYIGKRLRPQT